MNKLTNQQAILSYIKENPVMVLGTLGAGNIIHGAPVFVCATTADHLYFVTKRETQKFKDIMHNPDVSVTIVNPAENSTLQANGQAHVETEAHTIGLVMNKLTEIYATSADWLPPLAKLRGGPYEVVGINLEHSRLAHYKDQPVGSEHIFKEA